MIKRQRKGGTGRELIATCRDSYNFGRKTTTKEKTPIFTTLLRTLIIRKGLLLDDIPKLLILKGWDTIVILSIQFLSLRVIHLNI